MSRPDGRIEKGQRLGTAISARAWNRAQDAADLVLGVTPGVAGDGPLVSAQASNIVMVRNDGGQDCPAGGVLAISGVVADPTGGTLDGTTAESALARTFFAQLALTGGPPSGSSVAIAIALEPIRMGAIGRMAVGGAFPCRVNVQDVRHSFANGGGDASQLYSSECGVVQLLWKEQGVGSNKWAVGLM